MKTVSGGEFAEQILAELIDEGLSGEALLSKFKERQAQIRPAAEAMLHNAEKSQMECAFERMKMFRIGG